MHPYVKLAKETVEQNLLFGRKYPDFKEDELPPETLTQKGGVFVTLYQGDELRGCIGTILATQKNLAQEIIANSISAATADYRFSPITKKELPTIKYEVSILSKPEQIDSPAKLNPEKYGVIVESGRKKGLLLPDLEDVDTIDDQIYIAARKGGINLSKDKITLYRFTTTKYK
ncbi:MAG: AmmeMemoRadiSam system protein A [Patescibacteria group bacterium]|jgi:AMMECR1 domain-containing protein